MSVAEIVARKVEELIPYARNARTHSDAQVAQIAASIREFGWTNPILLDGQSGIIAGHGRLLAARKLGMSEVPCIELAGLTETQRKAYILADNKLAMNAGWDDEMLRLELGDLAAMDFDMSLVGFSDEEMLGLNPVCAEGLTDEDEVPEAPVDPVTKLGDVWILGRHRLMCGDSTSVENVAELMNGSLADMCFTSPPYGNQRDYTTGGIADWDGLMQGVFSILPVKHEAQVLVNLGMIHRDNEWIPYWEGFVQWMRDAKWRRFGWYVWDQGPGMPGDWAGRFAPSFEFVFHFNRTSRKPNKIVPCKHAGQESHLRADGSSTAMRGKDGEVGGWTHNGQPTQDTRIPDSVIRVMRHKARGIECGHPAVFPVDLVSEMLTAFSDPDDLVFEPFTGSGTQLISAQKNGRSCYGMEIAPQYCDIAVKRWQSFTGQTATLESTGEPFPECAQ